MRMKGAKIQTGANISLYTVPKFASQLYSFVTSGATECIFAIIKCSNTSRGSALQMAIIT